MGEKEKCFPISRNDNFGHDDDVDDDDVDDDDVDDDDVDDDNDDDVDVEFNFTKIKVSWIS